MESWILGNWFTNQKFPLNYSGMLQLETSPLFLAATHKSDIKSLHFYRFPGADEFYFLFLLPFHWTTNLQSIRFDEHFNCSVSIVQRLLFAYILIKISRFSPELNQQKHGPRMKCSACKIIAHASCIAVLMERSQLACKPTFRDVGVRQYREQTRTHHHWIHRRPVS